MLNLDLESFLAEVKALDLKQHQVSMEIDGIRYTSQKLGALAGLSLGPRVMEMFGPILDSIMLPAGESPLNSTIIMRVAAMAAENDALPKICKDMLQSVVASEVRGVSGGGAVAPHFDKHFAGEYMHLIKVLIFAGMHSFFGPTRGAS